MARQGLIGVLVRGQTGALIEVNCETDFVAKLVAAFYFSSVMCNFKDI